MSARAEANPGGWCECRVTAGRIIYCPGHSIASQAVALLPDLLCVNHRGHHARRRSTRGCYGTARQHEVCAIARELLARIGAL